MAPQTPAQHARHEPLYDIHPLSGISIEVFYSDRTLETFGRCGAGWFWWPRKCGGSPDGPASGPFATSYGAYRHALGTSLGTKVDTLSNIKIKSGGYGDLLAEGEKLGSNLLHPSLAIKKMRAVRSPQVCPRPELSDQNRESSPMAAPGVSIPNSVGRDRRGAV
jgi:hypothetical protein